MLLLPFFWLWIAGVSYAFGHALLGRQAASNLAPELVAAAGLAGLSWGLALLSLGTGIGPAVQVGVSVLAGLYAGWSWVRAAPAARAQWWAQLLAPLRGPGSSWMAALLLVFGGLVLVHAVQAPAFPDSALYHAQTVQWMQQYPVVPGLGNLHGRLAFNSHLHLLTAFFSASPGPRHPAWQQAAGSFWFLLVVSYGVRQTARARAPGQPPGAGGPLALPPALALYYLGAVALVLVAYRPWISSPMPDSGVALLTLLLLGWVLEKLATPGLEVRFTRREILLLAGLVATTITYKLSAACLVAPLGYAAWRLRPAAGRWLGAAVLVATAVLLPWVVRNVVLSGYLAYPLASWAGLPVEWRVPPTQVAADLREIRDFARWPAGGWEAVATMRPGGWLPFWWAQQFPGDRRLLAAVAALAVSLGLARLLRRRPAQAGGVEIFFFLLVACCGAWFAAAPAVRFGYGYLIGAVLVGGWLLVRRLPGTAVRVLSLALGLTYGLNGLRNEMRHFNAATWVWPADYLPLPGTTVLVQGRPVRVAGAQAGGRCGNCPLPCAAEAPPPDLRWRGPDPAQGFWRSQAPR